jgi:DNA polymerase V
MIFAASSPHDNNYYKKHLIYEFPVATDNNSQIASAINRVLREIFQSGIYFYRCGVGAISLESQQYQQPDLFTLSQPRPVIMTCFDKVNLRYGQGSMTLASEGRAESGKCGVVFCHHNIQLAGVIYQKSIANSTRS